MTATWPAQKCLPFLCAAGWDLLYPYTSDLMCLNSYRPPPGLVPANLTVINTPLSVGMWALALQPHPDQAFTRYVLEGLCHGFRIGFNRGMPLRSAQANMRSALLHPGVVSEYIRKELSMGRMLGPFAESFLAPEWHVSRFGLIPKGHNTGKWRLITDLSFPPGRSVNDGINLELCSLTCTTVDRVAEVAVRLGRGALMAKVDIESAYRLIPVHPHDHPLLAVHWEGQIFIDPMLPFGLIPTPDDRPASCRFLPVTRDCPEFRSDLAWWQCFIQSWNGMSFLPPFLFLPVCEMASDASGHWGCGAWFWDKWLQVQSNPSTAELPITVNFKELLPVVVAGVLWARDWGGHRIICHCDNQAVVACLKSRTSKHHGIMHLLRNLLFMEVHFGFHITPAYIDTRANHLAS